MLDTKTYFLGGIHDKFFGNNILLPK